MDLEQVIDDLTKEIRNYHIERLQKGKCDSRLGVFLTDYITNCERASDHCSNIAVCLIQTHNSSFETHDDYRKMANGFTNTYFHQPFVKEICPHLSYTELFGLSFKGMANWGLRHAIVFHPHILHASSDFTKYGVASKTNLVYSLLLK